MAANRLMKRMLLCRMAGGACVGLALAGCSTPAGYERPEPPADFRIREAPITRGQVDSGVVQVTWLRPGETVAESQPAPALVPPKAETPVKPLDVPAGIPGADVPRQVVPLDTPQTHAERMKIIDSLFPTFEPLGPDPTVDGAPGTQPATLDSMLDFALKNSPEIVQASADVVDAHGRWIQAGLYPNPTAGFQGDQMFDQGYAGQLGGYFNQSIVTAGKLKISRSVAHFDFLNARVNLRKAEVDLAKRVRSNYYHALVAAENVRIGRLVLAFTDDAYRRQVTMVKGGTAVAFEASALLALTGQAELGLAQARNRHAASWKQLAASINSPDLPPVPLAGKVDESLPRYRYESLRDQMLAAHTDLIVARNSASQAERTIVREQAKPIPDIQNQFYFQQDTQAKALGLPNFQMGAQIGVAVPIFDRNQGGIMSAKAKYARANAELPRVQNELVGQLAGAYERYETARQQAGLYRERILPNLVTAFRGVYSRYQLEPDKVNYNDIVTAQQSLVTQLGGYLQALQAQWQAQAELAGAVQVTDPNELTRSSEVAGPDTWPDTSPRRIPK